MRKLLMTMGIVMLMVTGIYAYDNSFDTDGATISTLESELPEDGERFVTKVTFPEEGLEGLYEGEVIREDGRILFDGQGKLVFKYGVVLEGYFEKNYIIKGKGSIEGLESYEGEFKDNQPHGQGKMTYNEGTIYEGAFDQGYPYGKGKLTSPDGLVYEGDLFDEEPHGQGKMIYPDGTIEEGTFIYGEFAGDSALPIEIDRDNSNYTSYNIELIPVEEAGQILVPLRYVAGPFDATFDWEHESKTVTITQRNTKIKMVIGSKTATVNGEKKELLAAPKLVNNEAVVPLKFICEAFYSDVFWDSEERIMYVRNWDEEEDESETEEGASNEEVLLERTFIKIFIGTAHYEGEVVLVDGEQIIDGQGKLNMPGEWVYEGEFKRGVFHGQGKLFVEDGTYYEVGFKNGKLYFPYHVDSER